MKIKQGWAVWVIDDYTSFNRQSRLQDIEHWTRRWRLTGKWYWEKQVKIETLKLFCRTRF